MEKRISFLLATLALAAVAFSQFPANTNPEVNDSQVLTEKKILRVLNDAKGGTAPLAASSARRGTLVSRSGTANGSSQSVAAANTTRGYFSFQNPSTNTGTFWVDPLGGTAAAGSPRIEVQPGQGFVWSGEAVPTNAITVIGTNTEKWTAYEF